MVKFTLAIVSEHPRKRAAAGLNSVNPQKKTIDNSMDKIRVPQCQGSKLLKSMVMPSKGPFG